MSVTKWIEPNETDRNGQNQMDADNSNSIFFEILELLNSKVLRLVNERFSGCFTKESEVRIRVQENSR